MDRLIDGLSDEDRELVRRIVAGEPVVEVPQVLLEDSEDERPLYALIKDMTMGQKIKLALFGNQTARNILIRDPNRMVAQFVLQNSRITDNEIVDWSRNKDLDDAILVEISKNSSWMKLYAVKLNLVSNPKVPASLSIKWLPHILEKDLRKLSRSRDIPQVVANQAARLLSRKG
jgi:hypothetical protein